MKALLFCYYVATILALALLLCVLTFAYLKEKKRLLFLLMFLFALYLLDIIFLFAAESIPGLYEALYDWVAKAETSYSNLFSVLLLYLHVEIIHSVMCYRCTVKQTTAWAFIFITLIVLCSIRTSRIAHLLFSALRMGVILTITGHGMLWIWSGLCLWKKKDKLFSMIFLALCDAAYLFSMAERLLYRNRPHLIQSVAAELITWLFILAAVWYLRRSKHREECNDSACIVESLASKYKLTNRETEILDYLVMGLTNAQIAEEACIAECTVKIHARHIYQKLAVENRKQLLVLVNNEQLHTAKNG